MANYIVSYDLNGDEPSHEDMDEHMEGAGWERARILESVWYVGTEQTAKEVFDYISSIMSENDQLMVVKAVGGNFRKLLVSNDEIKALWDRNR